jgi:hypothetical protein
MPKAKLTPQGETQAAYAALSSRHLEENDALLLADFPDIWKATFSRR